MSDLPPPPPPPPIPTDPLHGEGGSPQPVHDDQEQQADSRAGVFGRFRQRAQEHPDAEPRNPRTALDPVTGTPTRAELPSIVETAVRRSKEDSSLALLVFIGIGTLRDVNDTLGPDAGDLLLRQVTQRLATIDVPGTKVARYGGAELILMFERLPNAAAADEIGRFLIEFLGAPFLLGAEAMTIDVCIGASLSADNYDSLDEMIRDAHNALVDSREQGHGTYVIHDETKRARYSTRIDDRRVYQAVSENEFALHYQPIMRLDNEEIIGVEALIRWAMPGATNTGMLYPHDFLPMLEKTGLIVEVGSWVIDEACRQSAMWTHNHPNHKRLFVTCNLGGRQLASTGFRDTVTSALSNHDIEPWQLCLEITESALRFNRDTTWAVLRDLKDMGVKLSLDNFGTGVSTLSYLREFKLDLLRVDRSFVTGLEMSHEDAVIVKHVAGMAHDLGCHAIADGVETQGQVDILRGLGVDLAQGYHYGRAVSPEKIDGRLRDPDEPEAPDPWAASEIDDLSKG